MDYKSTFLFYFKVMTTHDKRLFSFYFWFKNKKSDLLYIFLLTWIVHLIIPIRHRIIVTLYYCQCFIFSWLLNFSSPFIWSSVRLWIDSQRVFIAVLGQHKTCYGAGYFLGSFGVTARQCHWKLNARRQCATGRTAHYKDCGSTVVFARWILCSLFV